MISTERLDAPRTMTVSAIVTTYNYAAFVADALDSILGQSRVPDEIVVIDDGSEDNTGEIVAAYADRAVRYIRQENQGAGAARNRGIAETSGEMIAFLDADDIWLPGKVDRQLSWLADNPDAALVSGQRMWWHVDRNERSVERFPILTDAQFAREVTIRNVVGNPSMTMIRRHAIESAGLFDTSLRWGQDWEMFVRLSRVGRVGFLSEPVIIYRWHRSSLSHDRRWERLATIHSIARRAIEGYQPRWRRPVLRLRAWSAIEFDRARFLAKRRVPRIRKIRHAGLALLSWPTDDTLDKMKLFGRALIGEVTYQRALASVRSSVRRMRSLG